MKTEQQTSIRPLTQQLILALELDVWPSAVTCMDFGIECPEHLGALQYAVKFDGVTEEELDKALGDGRALERLISPSNPYHGVTFQTVWDFLPSLEDEFAESTDD